jgi:hypothetical protein
LIQKGNILTIAGGSEERDERRKERPYDRVMEF